MKAIKLELEGLISVWQGQSHSSPKFKTTYSLFKERYKHTPTFKSASKYFDIEKIFKEACSSLSTGALPTSLKSSIEDFLSAAKLLPKMSLSAMLLDPVVVLFPGLSSEQKEQVVKEWKSSLPIID